MSRDWKDWLTIDTVSPDVGLVLFRNGKCIGEVVKDVDGYWKFDPESGKGLWDDSMLQMIADMLIESNMEWDREIKEYFENERLEESRTSLDAEGEFDGQRSQDFD